MHPIRTLTVVPFLPEKLERLRELALNFRWAWDNDTRELFRRLDRDLWEAVGHDPVRLLASLQQTQLEEAAADDAFLAHLDRVCESYDEYMEASSTWCRREHSAVHNLQIAYFSAEFGIAECLPIYSGGLGILAGDHLKSASDLGLPLVGVGLLYQEAYFHQYLNQDGWQSELYVDNDFYNMPLVLERRPDGQPLTVEVDLPGRKLVAQIWRASVGRVPLYLLDANLPVNNPEDRDVTERLYRGDPDVRIRQEILLGIGGVRALRALGLHPTVYHMNEGHSAFLSLERIREMIHENALSFGEAREACAVGNIFTTHTPVPAGIDYFSPEAMDRYFGSYYRELGLSLDEFLGLGRKNARDVNEPFCMAVLALRLASFRNGVSELHGAVSRRMWQSLWPNLPVDEIPITSVTNGVHPLTWISGSEVGVLYNRYLGPRWLEDPTNRSVWEAVDRIPNEELWNAHERQRERLVSFTRQRLRTQLTGRGASRAELDVASEALDPSALTIGFSRRFATYKRATLIFRDPDRLAKILGNREKPVQLIIAGKAHPEDNAGKELIRQIIRLAHREDLRRRVVFIEDYDMDVARFLVRGVDLWLTTPRRPLEASGTSGMKVALNGGLNMSVLDGWWAEAYRSEVGWAIGRGEEYPDTEYQDEVEANAIYDLLEKEVVPLFYDRGRDSLPDGWIARMKASMRHLCPVFNTNRMLCEYSERFYVPAASRYHDLIADGASRARELASWKSRVFQNWAKVRMAALQMDGDDRMTVGSDLKVQAEITLGDLAPEDVVVELYHGPIDSSHQIAHGTAVPMTYVGRNGDGNHTFAARIALHDTGLHGYTLRILPKHEDMVSAFDTGLIRWADSSV